MSVKSLDLVWITVSDFAKGVAYYSDVLGMELLQRSDEMGWAELRGSSGAMLGICRAQQDFPAGVNAIMTFTVENLDKAMKELASKGVTFKGEIQEVPGHVKMQLCEDPDGNLYHICEMLA
ncbi:MAG: VOC family protein [Parachlamydiales bacterium]